MAHEDQHERIMNLTETSGGPNEEGYAHPEQSTVHIIQETADGLANEGMITPDLSKRLWQLTPENTKNEALIEQLVESIAEETASNNAAAPASERGFISRLGKISAIRKGMGILALATSLEYLEAEAANRNELAVSGDIYATEKLKGVPTRLKPPSIIVGDNYAGIKDNKFSGAIQHNIHWPESLWDAGKMFIEPISFVMEFPYGKEGAVARFLIKNPEDRQSAFVVDVDIPYKFAADFERAEPQNQEKMEREMLGNARGLFEKLVPTIFGPSFWKKETLADTARFKDSSVSIEKMKITGFASPETNEGVNLEDARNQQLSKLRAENAAYVLRNIFSKNGIGTKSITYRGEGEIPLDENEIQRLLQTAYALRIEEKGISDKTIADLIERYNAGNINDLEALKNLHQIVGEKRKVAVYLELDERKGILIIPIPILLLLLGLLLDRRRENERRE